MNWMQWKQKTCTHQLIAHRWRGNCFRYFFVALSLCASRRKFFDCNVWGDRHTLWVFVCVQLTQHVGKLVGTTYMRVCDQTPQAPFIHMYSTFIVNRLLLSIIAIIWNLHFNSFHLSVLLSMSTSLRVPTHKHSMRQWVMQLLCRYQHQSISRHWVWCRNRLMTPPTISISYSHWLWTRYVDSIASEIENEMKFASMTISGGIPAICLGYGCLAMGHL